MSVDKFWSSLFLCFAKSRRKTIIIDSQRDDPMFCLVDHMISLALFDDAFEAESAKNVRNIFNVDIPESFP